MGNIGSCIAGLRMVMWIACLVLASLVAGAVPETDRCRRFSSSCDTCADFDGCYWCGQADGTGQCVENFLGIQEDCPLLVLTRSFCATDGLSLTPPASEGDSYRISLGSPAGLATVTAAISIILVLLGFSLLTLMCCPNKCGESPTWCCPFPKLYRWC